jgi:hypothetical protein
MSSTTPTSPDFSLFEETTGNASALSDPDTR